MLPYGATELASAYRTVRNNTIQVATDIPEDKYDFSAATGSKTVGQLLTHIAFGNEFAMAVHPARLTTLAGFNFGQFIGAVMAEEQKSRTKAELLDLLRTRGDAFATWLEGLDDAMLSEKVAMHDGSSRTRIEMIMGVKEHEMHHRGQLMLIERIVGVVPHLTRQMQERMAAMAATAKA
jgi:uncharacterized damage-inducible protein DinB